MVIQLLILILLVLVVSFLFVSPKTGTWILIFSCIFQTGYFLRWTIIELSRFWAWLPFLVAGILLLPLIMKEALQDNFLLHKRTPVQRLFLFVFILSSAGIISCLVNGISIATGIFGLRYYFIIVLMTSIFFDFKVLNLNFDNYLRFFVWVGIIQIPFTVLQRVLFSYAGVTLNVDSSDLICGTYSAYSTLAFMQFLALGIVICYWFRFERPILGKSVMLLNTLLFTPLLLSNSRASFLFFVIFLCLLAVRHIKKLMRRMASYTIPSILMLIIMFSGIVFGFGHLQKQDYNRDLKNEYAFDHMLEYISRPSSDSFEQFYFKNKDPRMGRLAAIITSYELITQDILKAFLGLGPGNTQKSDVLKQNGQYYQSFGVLSGLGRNQLSLTLSELGLLGLLLFILLFFWLLNCINSIKKFNILKHEILLDVYIIIVFLIFIFSIYSRILTDYAIILCVSFFIATLQHEYLVANKIID
ncbi:MAG: O-antigen ligase family protein [Candidatus Aureabacteria bacterium]|nr:O-antigen ligase family protein [Candidatus Auribacterota bacterium]